jgi:hypothetical protein
MTSEAQRADVQRRGAELADYLATALGTLARFAPRRVLSSTRVPA